MLLVCVVFWFTNNRTSLHKNSNSKLVFWQKHTNLNSTDEYKIKDTQFLAKWLFNKFQTNQNKDSLILQSEGWCVTNSITN